MSSVPGAAPASAPPTCAPSGADGADSPQSSVADSSHTGACHSPSSPPSCKRKRGQDPEPRRCFLRVASDVSAVSSAPGDAGADPTAAESLAADPTVAASLAADQAAHANAAVDPSASGQAPRAPEQSPLITVPNQPDTASETPVEPQPLLCQEQQDLVDLIASGRNVFYTGSAGCGKSTVLKAARKRLAAMGLTVHTLAPAGRAALQVNGTTTWSYMAWTPDHHKLPVNKLVQLAFRKHIRRRLMSTDVLIIDEISMVENHHLERINLSMKEARRWKQNNVAAFGGAQVIVTDDFCQLPPVKPFQHCITCGQEMTKDEHETEFDCPENHGPFREHEKWAFISDAWEEYDFAHVHLKQIHRQNDKEFIKMLQKCRLGIPFSPGETTTLMDHPCNVTNATRSSRQGPR